MTTEKTPLQRAENNINLALGAAGFLILMTLAMIALQLAPISGLVVVELVITTLGVWKVAANKSIPWMFVISLLIFGSEALDIAKGTYVPLIWPSSVMRPSVASSASSNIAS
jgi:hypothetical protein